MMNISFVLGKAFWSEIQYYTSDVLYEDHDLHVTE